MDEVIQNHSLGSEGVYVRSTTEQYILAVSELAGC